MRSAAVSGVIRGSMRAPWSLVVSLSIVALAGGRTGTAVAAEPLPEGDEGIAAAYPGDAGIDADPAVVFFDDFEGYTVADDLWGRYDNVYQIDQIRFATEPQSRYAGAQALEFTVPQQEAELSNAVDKVVSPELDVLFLRYYSKFSTPFDVVGSSHNGSSISAHYFVDGQATPGVPADGTNKFLVAYENWRGEPETTSPGLLNVYVYHPEQRDDYGDHFFPSGLVLPNTSLPFDFGPDFMPRPEVTPELDRWYCWEYMVQANTPGQRDGRIAAWLDGVLVADWTNLRLRDVGTLTIDRFGLSLHIGSNPNGEQKKWFDNVVAATSYIGPLYEPGAGGSDSGSGGADDTAGGGGSDAGSGGGGGSGSSGGAGTSSSQDEGPSSETDGGAPAEGEGGCGCTTDGRAGASGWWLGLGLLAAIGRRRRARAELAPQGPLWS